MPTLLEKPASAPTTTSALPSQLLRSRYNWERWRGVLITLVVGLAATVATLWALHPSWHAPIRWMLMADVWGAGLVLTALAVALGWRFAPSSLLDTAQEMDRHLVAKNRLEATAAWSNSTSLLAQAQREETAAYLNRAAADVKPVRALPWLVGGVVLLALTHLGTFAVWVILPLLHGTTPVSVPPAPKELPKATITWKSPEPESKANPIEEVPTVALAQSTTGLKDLTLEISVNGTPKTSVALPATPYDKAGKHIIKQSLYMDELGVEPFDVVSYYLRGQRITDRKVPDTTSAIQFIQVRPFREDVKQVPSGSANRDFNLLIELKLAQLLSVKENFVLAHTDLPVDNPIRMKENDRVGKNEGDLAKKTEEVVQFFIQDGLPAEMVDLLRQAEAPMEDASRKILATQNNEALPPQEKALNLIVEVEKFFHKVMADKSTDADGPPPDPFKDKQKHEMKRRIEGAAGQLEMLAKNQAKLADDLSHSDSTDAGNSPAPGTPGGTTPSSGKPGPGTDSTPGQKNAPGAPGSNPDGSQQPAPGPAPQAVDPFGPDSGKGTPAERQTRVLQGIETLLNTNNVLPPPVKEALQDARKDATDSMHQLDQEDETGAREPAARASGDLQRAIAEMNKAGDQATKLAMEDAQQKLNDLARQLRDLAKNGSPDAQQKLADLAKQVGDVRKQLEDEADRQQDAGSAADAQRLDHFAQAIAGQNVEKDLAGMSKSGLDANKALDDAQKLENLAGQAAQGALPADPSAKDYAALINALEKSRANLARLAQQQAGGQLPALADHGGAAPGQNPADGKTGTGEKPGDQGSGKKPGDQAGQGDGKQPGKDQSGQGPGQGQKPDAQQGQGQGQGPQTDAKQGEGDGQGQGQGQKPDAQQGQGPSPQTDGQKGEGQGQGQGQGQGEGQGHAGGDGGGGGQSGSGGVPTGQHDPNVHVHDPNTANPTTQTAEAYREVIDDLKDETQQAATALPTANVEDLSQSIYHAEEDTRYRPGNGVNIVHAYQAIAAPLEKLITDLKEAEAHAQRSDLVKQPDLDEAPPAYRSAVSDYFETMSRDYHPDSGDEDAKKP